MKQDKLEEHLTSVKEYLTSELSKIRTGRATASIVEDIKVEAYEGSDPLPIKELATVSTPDAQTITISPWDKSILKKIEEAIIKENNGLNPVNDGEVIRVPIPPLTEERRKEIAKEVSKLVENAKIRVRTIRQDAMKAIEEMQDSGVISEEDMYREKKAIEEKISNTNKELEEMGKKKKDEIMQI